MTSIINNSVQPLVSKGSFAPLSRHTGINREQLVYLDCAATCLMPACVLDAIDSYEKTSRSNVHRGIYVMAEESTDALESAREAVAAHVGTCASNIMFTPGTTAGLNTCARMISQMGLDEDSTIVIGADAHHSNYIPWQQIARKSGATLYIVGLTPQGTLKQEDWERAMELMPTVVALTAQSNVLGPCENLAGYCREAKSAGALVVLDCAQAAGHMPLDLESLGVDFAAWSAHKMYGPMGIGALYCSPAAQNFISPVDFGGGMASFVDGMEYKPLPFPHGFEAGTPNVSGAVGFARACRFLQDLGMQTVREHDNALAELLNGKLLELGAQILGEHPHTGPLTAFNLPGVHPHDAAQIASDAGIAVRAGHHCAQPLHRAMGQFASIRASFGVYNDSCDIERLCCAIEQAQSIYLPKAV